MDREAVKQLYRQKKGVTELSAEDEEFINSLGVREIVRIWEMVQSETDWEAEVYQLRQKKQDKQKKEAEAKQKDEAAKAAVEAAEETARKQKEAAAAREKAIAEEKAEEERKKKAAEEAERKKKEEEEARLQREAEEEAERELEEEMRKEEEAKKKAEAEAAEVDEDGLTKEEREQMEAELAAEGLDDEDAALQAEAEREAELALEKEIEEEMAKAAEEEEKRWAAAEAEREAEEAALAAKMADAEEEADDDDLNEEDLAALEAELEAEEGFLDQLDEGLDDEEAAKAAAEEEERLRKEKEEAEAAAKAAAEATPQDEAAAGAALAEAVKAKHEEQHDKLSKLRGPDGKFLLPDNFMDLTIDPRTELDLVDLPPDVSEKCSFMGSYPLVHLQGDFDKLNHLRKWDKRHVIITNYCIFVAHIKDGFCARCLEITEISKLQVSNDGQILHFVVPKEFDLILRIPKEKTPEAVNIVTTIYKYKKKKELPVEYLNEKKIHDSSNLKKPKHFVGGEAKHVHTKEELYKRLQAMNNQDDALLYLNLRKDPRTGLGLVEIPKELRHNFQSGPFKTDPLLHFFGQVVKINHKLGSDKRFCLCTNAALYLTYLSGKLHRCIIVHKVTEISVGASSIALKVPEEFDLYIKLPNAAKTRELETVLKTIFKFKMQREMPVSKLTPEAAANANQLSMQKPDKWKAKFVPVLQRKDLVDYLRKSGIRPDVEDFTN